MFERLEVICLIAERFHARMVIAALRRAVHSVNYSRLNSESLFRIFLQKRLLDTVLRCYTILRKKRGGVKPMMYPFLTLDDQTEIVHSEKQSDGSVQFYVEKPDARSGFHSAYFLFPACIWSDVSGFSQEELRTCQNVIEKHYGQASSNR